MGVITAVRKVCRYYRDPRPDLLPALKQMLKPDSRALLWDIVKYASRMVGYRLPVVNRFCVRGESKVDLERYMQAYDNTTASFIPYQELLDRIVELLDVKRGEVIYDLASGTGNLSMKLTQCGAQVVSLDRAPAAIAIHRRKDPEAKIVEVDLDRGNEETGFIGAADGQVDKFCGANFLIYVKNRATLFAEIRRLLKPGGIFVLQVEREGYDPLKIFKAHLRAVYRRYLGEGDLPLTAMAKVCTDLLPKYEDLLITGEETKRLAAGIAVGSYSVFTIESITMELRAQGFEIISAEVAYADQAIIVKAKPSSSWPR